jgi:hypothetical protein
MYSIQIDPSISSKYLFSNCRMLYQQSAYKLTVDAQKRVLSF